MSEKTREIIVSEARALSRRETGLSLWKPKHTLPVVGTAAVLWLGRKAARAVLARAASSKIPAIRIPERSSPQKPQQTTQQSPGKQAYRRITYRAYAEWIITKDE